MRRRWQMVRAKGDPDTGKAVPGKPRDRFSVIYVDLYVAKVTFIVVCLAPIKDPE